MQKYLVELENVVAGYEGKIVLDDVSFKIEPGQIVSLIGVNGAGKTTLLKLILGVLQPQSGQLKVATKKIGYVPQKLQFDTSLPLTVIEFLRLYHDHQCGLTELLENFKLAELAERRIGDLSGGQLQRVLLANAVAHKPDLLLLDEPISGLDVHAERSFYQFLVALYENYRPAIVLVSHDLHTVFARTDKVLCIDGAVCCQGKPTEVAEHPEFKRIFGEQVIPYQHHHNH